MAILPNSLYATYNASITSDAFNTASISSIPAYVHTLLYSLNSAITITVIAISIGRHLMAGSRYCISIVKIPNLSASGATEQKATIAASTMIKIIILIIFERIIIIP